MSLLHVFAHYGEAQSFLAELGAEREALRGGADFFRAGQDFILLCGEGEHAAAVNLTSVLASRNDISQIYNWGVVGDLRGELSSGDVLAVRTVYAQKYADDFRYHSFTLAENGFDLISAVDRVLDIRTKMHLARVAAVVDMELWGLCSVAKQFNVPLAAYKVISDEADGPVCDLVREKARVWSDLLYERFLRVGNVNKVKRELAGVDLYLTQSQRQRLTKLLKNYQRRHQLENPNTLPIFRQFQELPPKKRTGAIISWFENELQPIRKQMLQRVEQSLAGLKKDNVQVQFDHSLESTTLKLHLLIKSRRDLREIAEMLQSFDFDEYEQIFTGANLEI